MTTIQTYESVLDKESYSPDTLNLAYDKFMNCVSHASKELIATLEVPFAVLFGDTFSVEFSIAVEDSSQKYIADIDRLLKVFISKATDSSTLDNGEFSKDSFETIAPSASEKPLQDLLGDSSQEQAVVAIKPDSDADQVVDIESHNYQDHNQFINIAQASVDGAKTRTYYVSNGQTFDLSTDKVVLGNKTEVQSSKIRYITILPPKGINTAPSTERVSETQSDAAVTGTGKILKGFELLDTHMDLQLGGAGSSADIHLISTHTDSNMNLDNNQTVVSSNNQTALEREHSDTEAIQYVSSLQAADVAAGEGQTLELAIEQADLEQGEHVADGDVQCVTHMPAVGSIAVKCDEEESKLVESAIAADPSVYEQFQEDSGYIWDEDERKRGRPVFTNVNADKEDVDFEYSVAPISRKKPKRKALEPGAKPGWPCEICGDILASKIALTRHINFAHPSVGKWKCAVCYEILPAWRKLRMHFRTEHMTEGEYCCPVCGFSFRCPKTFEEHLSGCTFTPEDAGYSEPKPREDLKDGGDKEIEENDPARPFKCEFCSRKFKSKGILTNHITQRHLLYTPGSTNSCDVCEKRFTKPYYYVKHCDTPTHVKKMREKYGIVDEEDRSSSQGAHGYTNLANSPTPYKRANKKKAPKKDSDELNICDVCGRSDFSSKSNLYIHIRTHTKPFECDFCGKRFADKKHMRAHRRLHTGETPFMCHICGKSFREQYLLKNHTSMSHSDNVYKCNDCQILFKYKRNLYMHMKKKHGVSKFEIVEPTEFHMKEVKIEGYY